METTPGVGHWTPGRKGEPRGGARVIRTGVIAGILLAGTLTLRAAGYQLGLHTLVRCRAGHPFKTIWIPGASVKALRLGWWRVQRCPVGQHWSLVAPVRESDLTAEQRRFVAAHHESGFPDRGWQAFAAPLRHLRARA